MGFRAKRDLRVLRINNEKRGDKRFLTFVCEYNANDACDLCHDCITTSVHVGASFRRSLDRNLTLFEEVTASYGNGIVIATKRGHIGRSDVTTAG